MSQRSGITFTLGQGNSPGALQNNDGICGLQFYGTAPGSFATTACQAVFSTQDAINKGIALDYADETRATGSIVISNVGSTGDIITLTVSESVPVTKDNPTGTNVVTLCSYAQTSADTTATLLAASIASAILANSYQTAVGSLAGYSASAATGTLTVTARQGLGINLNTKSLVATITGTITTGTNTAFSGGVYSKKAIWNYHVTRFFKQNPNGKVWVQFTSTPGASFAEMQTLAVASSGEPRKIGILNFVSKTASQVTADLNLLQGQANTFRSSYTPADILYVPNIKAISDLSTLQNLQNNATAQNTLCVISQDGAAQGAQLFINSGVAISNLGDILGVGSLAAPSQDIGEVASFNISDGVENNIPAFTNGSLVSSVANSLLDTLDGYRYLFCVNYTGYPGTYINNDWTAVNQTNSYNRLSRTQVIGKVLRTQYQALLPLLKSRIYLNADGTMTTTTLNKYLSAAEPAIEQMVRDGDLSPGNISGTALTTGVLQISPTQNVQSQGYIAITCNLLAVNIADSINVTLQFTQKL